MYGVAQIVNQSPEIQHVNNLTELSNASNKCAELSDRAMKSSIHCASSIANINTILKTDIKNILEVMDLMNSDIQNVTNDISIMTCHLSKLNGSMYDLQDIIKDKFKSYDELFETFNRKLNEYGDIVKDCGRQISHLNDDHKPKLIKSSVPTKRLIPKPSPK